jgi:hypothetical protein
MKLTLNSNKIKIIAIAAMTVDHVAWLLFPYYSKALLPLILHIIGRLTCPIMCFFVAEGYHHTKNVNKYTARLFLFAVISHFPYMLASISFTDWKSLIPFFGGSVLNQTGVMWALAWGLVMLRVANSEKIKNGLKTLLIILCCIAAFPSDWSCIASLCVLAFGTNRGKLRSQALWMIFYVALYATVYFFALDRVYGIIQMAVVLAIPVLALYNGERGKYPQLNKWMKWTFYIYYPLHLLIIGLIRIV